MGVKGLAQYFTVKYAGNKSFLTAIAEDVPTTYEEIKGPADTSLGAPVSASMAQRYRDKLVAVYDRIKEELTQLPFFQQLNADMKGEPVMMVFNDIIDAYTVNVGSAPNLKSAFMFGIKYVEAFNNLRDKLPGLVKDREKMHRIDEAIYNTQMYLWGKLKAMLDLHKIGSGIIPMNEAEKQDMFKILGTLPQGTWHYGPMRNPTKGMFNTVKHDTVKTFKDRMKEEMAKDEVRKRLGPYATENEVIRELERSRDQDKKQRQDVSKQKYQQSLFGKEKNKLR